VRWLEVTDGAYDSSLAGGFSGILAVPVDGILTCVWGLPVQSVVVGEEVVVVKSWTSPAENRNAVVAHSLTSLGIGPCAIKH
jgi:hypothetical protein